MASYLGNNPDNIIKVRKGNYRYVATSGQTVFSGTDSNSLSMSINTADVEVFLNGVLLDQTDYTATISTVTLGAGATINDIVEVITNTDFQVASLYTKEEVDSKVATAITNLVGTAGSALNTLGELSDALNDDANYAATITTALGTKANTSALATVATSGSYADLTNKPTIPTVSATAVSDQDNTSTGYFDLPAGTTAQRPGTANAGYVRYNTTQEALEMYDGANWLIVKSAFTATGGVISDNGGYRYHTFTTSGTFQVTKGTKEINYLIVAGGGGGGWDWSGGGGAGGYLSGNSTVSINSYAVTVGSGGAAATSVSAKASNGNNSSAFSLTAIGGGGGGSDQTDPGASGGSGGGGAIDGAGGSGTSGQGNAGASGNRGDSLAGGGGGGASAVGSGGTGGAGTLWLNGSYYAGGGGGGRNGTAGTGGIGGGGNGGNGSNVGLTAGSTNTGGGGGGGGAGQGAIGGSGIVIIRYLN